MVVAIIAVVISILTLYHAKLSHKDELRTLIVEKQYSAFDELAQTRLQNWELAHVFELSENYDKVITTLKSALNVLSEEKKAELILRERAIAMYIFQTYENSYYQWKNAIKAGDKERKNFLDEVLGYYAERLLRNPRLLYYWDKNGGNLSGFFEEVTQQHYNDNVISKLGSELSNVQDENGPFS
jgi:hypothetical protein